MIKLIAETAMHHEGDFFFMKDLVSKLCEESIADIIKMHVTLDFDEYMMKDHSAYTQVKNWLFSEKQWEELIHIVRVNKKDIMLLLNDTAAINFAKRINPEYVELHSACLNVPRLQKAVLEQIDNKSKIVIGVGGCTLQEVDEAVQVFRDRDTILMFGFQNYPTNYADINLGKIRKIQLLHPNKQYGYADHTAWDEKNNELITLMVSANSMRYVEKHVTTECGKKRCDYSAAVSIKQFNSLGDKIKLLDQLHGDGFIRLNQGEKAYSKYGPMKMAGVAKCYLKKGDILKLEDINFCRTSQHTKISQIELLQILGGKLVKNINRGEVFDWSNIDDI